MKVNGNLQLFFTNILQNICFYVQQKKEIHTGLEQHEWYFWVNYPLKVNSVIF